MKKRSPFEPRKTPKQARSLRMRDDILAAGIRVLRREGLLRFNTPRVAEVAGISVGSLYQYFPNKQAILFAIHSRTVDAAWLEVQRILDADGPCVRAKVRLVAELFFRSETEDVAVMGPAAQQMDLHFAGHPDHQALNVLVARRFTSFLRKALPPSTPKARVAFATELLMTVLDSVGRSVAARQMPPREVDAWAAACADMVADFIGLPAD